MKVYTRKGDTGYTALFGGKQILKCEELVEMYGSLDELNSRIGLIASQIEVLDVQEFLFEIQKDLLQIGCVLAGWSGKLKGIKKRVYEMEARIDMMDKELPKLQNFILPGGSELGARLHITRSICRKVERQLVSYKQEQTVDSRIIPYLNRLSDLLFVLARFINKQAGAREILWTRAEEKNT